MRVNSAVLGVVCGLAMGFGLVAPATAQKTNATPSYLFVFEGQNAELRQVGSKGGKFELTVPIRRNNHLVTWFTDRPVRDAGHISLESFVALWQQEVGDGFKADPPNVALAFGGKSLVATMTNPKIVRRAGGGAGSGAGGAGSGAGGGEVLVSTMTLIKGNSLAQLAKGSKGVAAHAKRAGNNSHSGKSMRIGSLSVFVDDVTTPGVITTGSGLQYRDVTVGTGDSPSGTGATVVVNYTGSLLDGTQFAGGSNVSIDLGGAISGLQEGVSSMKVGGRRQLIVPANLAYGSAGTANIPPNSTLVFDVQLLSTT